MPVSQYRVNGQLWPQPDSTSWEDLQNGVQLGTNLPVYSPYRRHTWNMPVLPNCDYASMLEAIRNTELTSLTTDSPDDAEELTIYDEAKVISIRSTHSWGHPRSLSVVFEVMVG
jgi:hypothetical protein